MKTALLVLLALVVIAPFAALWLGTRTKRRPIQKQNYKWTCPAAVCGYTVSSNMSRQIDSSKENHLVVEHNKPAGEDM